MTSYYEHQERRGRKPVGDVLPAPTEPAGFTISAGIVVEHHSCGKTEGCCDCIPGTHCCGELA